MYIFLLENKLFTALNWGNIAWKKNAYIKVIALKHVYVKDVSSGLHPCFWLIKNLLHLRNLKNTFLCEVAQIYSKSLQTLLSFDYPIFGFLTPSSVPGVVLKWKPNTPVLVMAKKASSN